MFRLPLPSTRDLEEYYNLIKSSINKGFNECTFDYGFKVYLNEGKRKQIITGPPDKLFEYHEEAMNLLIENFNHEEFLKYNYIRNKNIVNHQERALIAKYAPIKQLEKVFNYRKFISASKPTSYEFAKKLGRETCTYCNRLYAQTIIGKSKKENSVNNVQRITRPDFDHWFPKSKYPLLALSYFNLIPCCGVCNTSIKGSTEFKLQTHIHPYVHEVDQKFHFTYKLKDVQQNNVKVVCAAGSKIDNTIKAFKIQEVYEAHSGLELKDLLDMRYKYSENYLDTILNRTFKPLDMDKQEVYRLVFGVESDEDFFHKRPFSKFKRDILGELGIKL